jgi:hypothetical protein
LRLLGDANLFGPRLVELDWHTGCCDPGGEEAVLDRLRCSGREVDVGPLLEPVGRGRHGREATVGVWHPVLVVVGKGKKTPLPLDLVVLDPGASECGTHSDVDQLLATIPNPFADDHHGVVPWVFIPAHLAMDNGIT